MHILKKLRHPFMDRARGSIINSILWVYLVHHLPVDCCSSEVKQPKYDAYCFTTMYYFFILRACLVDYLAVDWQISLSRLGLLLSLFIWREAPQGWCIHWWSLLLARHVSFLWTKGRSGSNCRPSTYDDLFFIKLVLTIFGVALIMSVVCLYSWKPRRPKLDIRTR
jgi:hypothetical protein